MKTGIISIRQIEKKGAKVVNDGIALYLSTTRNGYQWSSFEVDEKLLVMIRDAANEALSVLDHPAHF